MIKFAKTTYYASFILLVLTVNVTSRFLHYSNSALISDGTDDTTQEKEPSFLHLKGIDVVEERCEQMYGFLPCSETLLGHFFLIVVYEYLLYHGESYVVTGGKRIFQILGPGIFGASAFQVLGFLPESFILLGMSHLVKLHINGTHKIYMLNNSFFCCLFIVSGLSNTKDVAQENVLTGVGLLAGSAILLLSLIWGTCVVIGSREFSSECGPSPSPAPTQNQYQKLLSFFTG